MGQKVHPLSFRLGYIKGWKSSWFAANKKDYANLLHEDIKIRKYIKDRLASANVSKVETERASDRLKISIHTSRPGIVIGRRGADIDRLRDELQEMTGKQVFIDIKEIRNPSLEAQLVAENVAFQLMRRISHRRAMKKAVQLTMDAGAKGIKIKCAGRLGGIEMSRREGYKEGKVPLHTIRADIDYGFTEARTTYGAIGVKVWIYKGDILPETKEEKAKGRGHKSSS